MCYNYKCRFLIGQFKVDRSINILNVIPGVIPVVDTVQMKSSFPANIHANLESITSPVAWPYKSLVFVRIETNAWV
jgi:hypothetical protein